MTRETEISEHTLHVQELFVEHVGGLKYFILSMLPDPDEAQDIVQETFNGSTINDTFTRNPKFISDIMNKFEKSEDVVRHLYVKILTRQPSSDELNYIFETVSRDKKQDRKFYENIAWALMNSSEFIFNH